MRKVFIVVLCAMLYGSPLMAEDSYDRVFANLDKNGDGSLSRKEFAEGRMEIDRGKAVKLFPGIRDIQLLSELELRERFFDLMDRNHDGLLSRDEWRRVAPNILIIRF